MFREDHRGAPRTPIFQHGPQSQSAESRRLMTTAPWRQRLTLLAMSLVVGWHSFAMIVAPMPADSDLVQWLRSLALPYVSLLRLDNRWSFFAPVVYRQTQFRYAVEDGNGKQHIFTPVTEAASSIPQYVMWREFKYAYEGLMEDPESRTAVTAMLCKKHADLKPRSVSFLVVQEHDFTPEDYLQGYRPLDPDFTTV